MIACVQITTTTIGTSPLTTGTTSTTTTTTLPPTTTTMNFCVEEKGMNQPLTITPDQIQSNPQPQQTTPSGDINPTPGTPGLNYPSPNPQINVTLNQPTTLTVIYLPVDTPNKPSNVQTFQVVFVYPNGTTSTPFTSIIPSTSTTTTTTTTTPSPSAGAPSQPLTTPSPTAVVPPSSASPQVDLPPNFQLPPNTIVVITITSTTNGSNPTGVCEFFFFIVSVSIEITYEMIL
jgi:hypothetical protein